MERPQSAADFVPADFDRAIEPGQLYIPALNVNTRILSLPTTMEPDPFLGGQVVSSFGVPPDLAQTAWWADGPALGGPGMAVITGHSSGTSEQAVFNRLVDLKPGDVILAESPDGAIRIRYAVIQVVKGISKSDPSALQTTLSTHPDNARLALLTCDGPVDGDIGESPDNTVVFASRS
ncbi:MAG: class F sortase [Nocardiaceae bacterium]|nr:class F sortase [Nocardiaceae bacterium]